MEVFCEGSVPVSIAARVYGKDASWVRAGIIAGWLPIGKATRNGKLITRIEEMKECFDQEREARINRDKQYTKLFEEHEKFKKNCQRPISYRPCYVEGRPALFHGWFTEPMRSYRNPDPTNVAYGLVEFENGNLKKVNPYEVRFMDDEVRRVWEGKE